jgi:ATPase subunit of ABC transporter with duplicated ATPase domains
MVDISVRNIKKAFEEGKDILCGLTFDIDEGERVGLLGKNGAGKTTLLRILTGQLEADEGEVALPKHRRLGLISQIPVYPALYTTEDVLVSAQRRLLDMRAQLTALEKRLSGDASDALLAEYDALAYAFERDGGWDVEFERNRVANGLQIPAQQRGQLFSTLSGGEKTRVNLARLILEDTDILLLDEPTNHLDIRATEWLEAYLDRFKGTVLVISHDRYFLDSVTRRDDRAHGREGGVLQRQLQLLCRREAAPRRAAAQAVRARAGGGKAFAGGRGPAVPVGDRQQEPHEKVVCHPEPDRPAREDRATEK